jgi:hypothetical protein
MPMVLNPNATSAKLENEAVFAPLHVDGGPTCLLESSDRRRLIIGGLKSPSAAFIGKAGSVPGLVNPGGAGSRPALSSPRKPFVARSLTKLKCRPHT